MPTTDVGPCRVLPFDQNLPINLRINLKDLQAAESIWTQGYAVLGSRLNKSLSELFPKSPTLRISSAPLPSSLGHSHGLRYYQMLFRAALPVQLVGRIPSTIQIVQGPANSLAGTIQLRDGEQVLPWCIGFRALGCGGNNPDTELLSLTRYLRVSGRNELWLQENIIRPTNAQAATWRLLFQSWRWRLAQTRPVPPENLTQAQLDIWLVLAEANRRMTAQMINTELAKKGLRQSPGMLRQRLADMCRNGQLTNRRDTKPRGYGLPDSD